MNIGARSCAFRAAQICLVICILLGLYLAALAFNIAEPVGPLRELIQPVAQSDLERIPAPEIRYIPELIARIRREGAEFRFDWTEWLDTAPADIFDDGNLNPVLYPMLSTVDSFESVHLPYTVQTTQYEVSILSAKFIKERLPAPAHVVQLAHPNYNGTTEKPEFWNVRSKDESRNQIQFGHNASLDIALSTEALCPDFFSADVLTRSMPKVPDEMFHWSTSDEIDRLGSDNPKAKMLKNADNRVSTSQKHFEEVYLEHDQFDLGSHYDWRFFRRMESYPERTVTINELANAWSQFARSFGIEYWWAHGTILGWWWNGMTMPWDEDIDLQVPIKTLDRLAWDFNYTLVVPHPSQGSRIYLLEVNPWYVQREHGNGLNVIDARYIDLTTGSYIDITGLSYLNGEGDDGKVHCKMHDYDLKTIVPPKLAMFEGALGYVPHDVDANIRKEYENGYDPKYRSFEFNYKTRLWHEPKAGCIEDTKFWDLGKCMPSLKLNSSRCDYEAYHTCNAYDIGEFESTKDYTLAHELEKELWSEITYEDDETVIKKSEPFDKLVALLSSHYSPLHRLNREQQES